MRKRKGDGNSVCLISTKLTGDNEGKGERERSKEQFVLPLHFTRPRECTVSASADAASNELGAAAAPSSPKHNAQCTASVSQNEREKVGDSRFD